jgi:hypothetical protein
MQLTYMSRDFYFFRMKQYAIMSVALAAMLYVLRTWYVGKSVATLPFAPMFPFSRLAHQWLEKPAPTDCRYIGVCGALAGLPQGTRWPGGARWAPGYLGTDSFSRV